MWPSTIERYFLPIRVTLFMDDIDSPDLAIFASAEVIARLEKRVKLE